jgi:ATP-binding cassette subfamily F protein 3
MIDFPGTMIFISHDPTFLARIATRVVEIEDGNARNFFGDYEYYLWKKAQEFESIKESSEELSSKSHETKSGGPTKAMVAQSAPKAAGGDRRDLNKTQARLEKQVARAEAEITEHEAKIKERDQLLADPALYQESSKWNSLHQEQDSWKKDLERLTARWESLSSELADVKQKLAAIG